MKGIYCLIIDIEKPVVVNIGALGNISFDKCSYCYVGSAQNNIEKRVSRHLSTSKKIRWHIDYLLNNNNASITNVYYKETGKEDECKLAKILAGI